MKEVASKLIHRSGTLFLDLNKSTWSTEVH